MKRDDFSNDQIKDALDKSHGIVKYAARRLKIHRNTLANWLDAEPELREHQQAGRESLLDLAEGKLVENIKAGKEKSIMFALSTLGKDRGYVERHEYAEHVEQPLFPDQEGNLEPEEEEEEEGNEEPATDQGNGLDNDDL